MYSFVFALVVMSMALLNRTEDQIIVEKKLQAIQGPFTGLPGVEYFALI